jgi:hypothetical protein
VLVAVPKLGDLRPAGHAQQLAGEDHPAGCLPAEELDQALAHLAGLNRGPALPPFLRNMTERAAYQAGQLLLHVVLLPFAGFFVPNHHRVVTQAEIAPVEPHIRFPEPELRTLLRLPQVRSRHRSSRPEPVGLTQWRLGNQGQPRMGSAPAGIARFVPDLRTFVAPMLRPHRRVHIQLRQRPLDWLRVAVDRIRTGHRIHWLKELSQRVVAHNKLKTRNPLDPAGGSRRSRYARL